jgi:hypothetical protein
VQSARPAQKWPPCAAHRRRARRVRRSTSSIAIPREIDKDCIASLRVAAVEVSMRKSLLYPIGLFAFFAFGYVAAHVQLSVAQAQGKPEKAAYLIASTKSIKPDQMGPYREAAGPLAKRSSDSAR